MSERQKHQNAEPDISGEPLENKRAYLLWYGFLLLARRSSDTFVQEAVLEDSEEFYRPWEADKGLDPEEWWSSHSHLFRETLVVRRLQAGEQPRDPHALLVEIPLRKSARSLAREVEKIVAAAIATGDGNTGKSPKKPSALYSLSGAPEPKFGILEEMMWALTFRMDNEDLGDLELLQRMVAECSASSRRMPMALIFTAGDPTSERRALKNLRRYLKHADHILFNVAIGWFPGNYGELL